MCYVGYDMRQNCCERANWYIDDADWSFAPPANARIKSYQPKNEEIDDYVINKHFIAKTVGKKFGCGGMITFRIDNSKNGDVKYLHLFNIHNGYYKHGFELSVNKDIILEDML